jgi:hypothetical protein
MILPDFASASDDMALLRRFLPLMPAEAVMPAIRNADLHVLRDRLHMHIGFVMRAREGVHAHDGSQTLATAKTTLSAAQNLVDELSDELARLRVEFILALPAEAQAFAGRSMLPSPSPRPSPDAGFSGFASPAGA